MKLPLQPRRTPHLLALLCLLGAAVGCDRGDRPDQLGQRAPQIALDDGARGFNLAAEHGHVVLLNFWASWCAPCIVEMPGLEALQHDLPQLRVVGVAFDEDKSTYNDWLLRHPLGFFTVLDTTGKAHASFGTYRPPETYLIDKNGVIRRKFIGVQDWTSPEIEATIRKLAAS